jgi:hypothetical protein
MRKIIFYFHLFGIGVGTFIRSVLSLPWFFFCLTEQQCYLLYYNNDRNWRNDRRKNEVSKVC